MPNQVVVTQLVIDASGAQSGSGQYQAAMDKAEQATARLTSSLDKSQAAIEAHNDNMKQLAAANDNVTRSWTGVIDGAEKIGSHLENTTANVLNTINHLKLLALGAYALSPAFRSVVNSAIPAAMAAIGTAAASAAATILSVLAPALSFFARITGPIALAVLAWKGLNYVIDQGSQLLDKYGNASRQFDISGMADKLKDLTKYQGDLIPADQAQRAAELADRLNNAKTTIKQFFDVQLDVTSLALKLQAVWVGIVEAIAGAVRGINALIQSIPDWLVKFVNAVGTVYQIGTSVSFPGMTPPSSKGDKLNADPNAAALAAAKQTLSAAMGVANLDKDGAAIGSTFAARWNQAVKALTDTEDQTKKTRSEFDRLAESMERNAAKLEADAKAAGASAGEHARLEAQLRLTEAAQQEITRKGSGDLADYADRIAQVSQRVGEAAQAAAQANAQARAAFELETAGLSDVEQRIAQVQYQLHGSGWKDFMNDGLSATMRLTDEIKKLNDATRSFGQDLLSGLLSGQDAMKSLTGAAQRYISTLASATLNRVQNGGSFFGNQSLLSVNGGIGVAASGLAGYQSGSPLTGALGGVMAGSTFGPVGAVVGGLVGAIGGIFGADEQKKKAEEARQAQIQAAKDAWKNMETDWQGFLAQANGGAIGSVQTGIAQIRAQETQFVGALYAQNPGVETAQMDQTHGAADVQVTRLIVQFKNTFAATIDSLARGFGPDSPFMGAFNSLMAAAKTAQGFVSDTAYVVADSGNAQFAADKIEQARQASRNYLLSLLQTAPALTDTQKAIQELNGKASALQQSLIDLGMSSADAATAIQNGVTQAMDALRTTFTKNLQAKFYDASGQGYINDIQSLADEVSGMRADAQALGADTGLIDRYFTVAAQKIVDGAQVSGTAFDQLAAMFPAMADGVHAYSAALAQANTDVLAFAKTLQAKYNDAAGLGFLNDIQNLIDEVSGLRSTAQANGVDGGLIDRYFTVAAQKIVDGAQISGAAFDQLAALFPDLNNGVHGYTAAITDNSTAVDEVNKSLQAANDNLQTMTQQLQSAFDRTKQFVSGMKDFQNSLLIDNSLSPLSPADRLRQAQKQYYSTQAAAEAGDATAQGALQNAASAYLNEAKSFYASDANYAAIFNEVQTGNQAAIDAAQGQISLAQQQVDVLRSIDSNVISLSAALINYNAAASQVSTAQAAVSQATATQTALAIAGQAVPMLWGTDIPVAGSTADQRRAAQIAQGAGYWVGVGGQYEDGTIDQGGIASAAQVAWAIDHYKTDGITHFANGGIVGNGVYNMDSVMARYAGGGYVNLAGGEAVINAAATRALGPSVIDLINNTGRLPANDNGDWAPYFNNLARVTATGFNNQTDALVKELQALRAEVRALRDTTRTEANRPGMPGKKHAA